MGPERQLPNDRVTLSGLAHAAAAGCNLAVTMLPKAMAYAVVAGVPPAYGLYASCAAPALAVPFGSNRLLFTGPVGVMTVLVLGALHHFARPFSAAYVELAASLTLRLSGLRQPFRNERQPRRRRARGASDLLPYGAGIDRDVVPGTTLRVPPSLRAGRGRHHGGRRPPRPQAVRGAVPRGHARRASRAHHVLGDAAGRTGERHSVGDRRRRARILLENAARARGLEISRVESEGCPTPGARIPLQPMPFAFALHDHWPETRPSMKLRGPWRNSSQSRQTNAMASGR